MLLCRSTYVTSIKVLKCDFCYFVCSQKRQQHQQQQQQQQYQQAQQQHVSWHRTTLASWSSSWSRPWPRKSSDPERSILREKGTRWDKERCDATSYAVSAVRREMRMKKSTPARIFAEWSHRRTSQTNSLRDIQSRRPIRCYSFFRSVISRPCICAQCKC